MDKKEYYTIKTKSLFGDAEALFELAWMYIWGIECDVDFDKAYSLLEKAAQQGFYDAKKNLKDNLTKEDGVVKLAPSFEEVYEPMRALRLAAENGDATAQYMFGQAKATATEDEVSPYMKKRGLIWLNKSAKQNYPPAMFLLGRLYLYGAGVPKDEKKGLFLIKGAARGEHIEAIRFLAKDEPQFVLPILNKLDAESNAEAQGLLGQMYLDGVGVECDTNKGISYLERSANNGNTDSIFNLGLFYEKGMNGVPEDIDKAIYWFDKGADAGDVQCMINLGSILQDKDPKKAFDLLTKAAEEEEPNALCNLGTLYKRGLGCEKDPEKSLSCYERSANAGCVAAMVNLVKYYVDDVAVPHDYEQANKWLLMAADHGDEESIMMVAKGYADGDIFPQDYDKAVKYLLMAIEKNNPKAMVYLGRLYRSEKRWEDSKRLFIRAVDLDYIPAYYELGRYYCYPEVQDYVEAARYFAKAAEAGYPPAEYEIGVCYKWGDGVEKNMEKALYWITKSHEGGYALATNNLGIYYMTGQGVEKDLEKAVGFFREAAEKGICDSQTMLGRCYFYGEGLPQNYLEAFSWFSKAAEQEDPDAQYHLYLCYSKGLGVEVDMEKAMNYLHHAAEEGRLKAAIQELEKFK